MGKVASTNEPVSRCCSQAWSEVAENAWTSRSSPRTLPNPGRMQGAGPCRDIKVYGRTVETGTHWDGSVALLIHFACDPCTLRRLVNAFRSSMSAISNSPDMIDLTHPQNSQTQSAALLNSPAIQHQPRSAKL